ncbi:hypothetical protein QBC40DRAFT_31554 [Triangularia verruculosa]|uniref:Zn(2)-C6 fungal-type domain-containing protein n=1 Tax=Triangularia verruculosa TaxID=2587418 RepID=A0AAN6XLS7_9PEZI|nr:hypothetical protein QBC40DRAFT_31554 [Triangularia verruculosa]
MESPHLRPTGALPNLSRCRSPIDVDIRQPKRRRQLSGIANDSTPSLPVSSFSLIPSPESDIYGGLLYHHPTFAPSLHGFGNKLDGAALPAWYSYDYKQVQQEPLFSLVVDSSTMGGGDVPPVLGEYSLESSVSFATHQPLTSLQYVDSNERWEPQADHTTPDLSRHSPAENDDNGFAQAQPIWDGATISSTHLETAFQAALPHSLQSDFTSAPNLLPPPPDATHLLLSAPREISGGEAYLSQAQPPAVYGCAAPGNIIDLTTGSCFGAYTFANANDGGLGDSSAILFEAQASEFAYVHVSKHSNGHVGIEPRASELQDIDGQILVMAETPLIGNYVNVIVKQERLEDVTEESVATVSVKPRVGVEEEQMREEGRGWDRDILRKQTSETRVMRACIRCHNQRVRCRPNTDNPNDPLAPCVTCLNVRRESKKTIHNLPCLRYKLSSVVLHRNGGLGYTNRFSHTQMGNIPQGDWTEKGHKIIEMAQGLCEVPMTLKVRAFRAIEGDKLVRHFVGKNGVRLPAYGLIDIRHHAASFQKYLAANANKGLEESVTGSDDLVKDMYAMIASQLQLPSKPSPGEKPDKKSVDQSEFLQKAVRLWFAIRHQTGSAWICGDESLGMESIDVKARYIPRMIVAQFDSIRYQTVFKSQVPQFLRMLEKILSSWDHSKGSWFTAFMVIFLFLHNVSCICKDRYRHAQENSQGQRLETRYGARNHPLTKFVEDLQHGAAVMLAYWTYFKRCDLMNCEWDAKSVSKSALQELEPYQLAFLKGMVDCLKPKLSSIPTTPEEGCWEHELYWISLMFVTEPSMTSSWKPPAVFSVASPSVGNER